MQSFKLLGGAEEIDDDEPEDIIQITWKELPKLIPVLRFTINDKKEFFSDKEINGIKGILADYRQIEFDIINYILRSPMTYDALNHPDEEYLNNLYPSNIMNNMPDWIRKYLASKESQKACELYADTILSDSFLLSQVMKDYDVSQNGIDSYQSEINEDDMLRKLDKIEENEDVEEDEPEDEETFRARNEECCKQTEEKFRPFVNWRLSKSCQNITESIDYLEKLILKKPFCGTKLKMDRNSAKESLNGIVAKTCYESEKKRLDRVLSKQNNDSSL